MDNPPNPSGKPLSIADLTAGMQQITKIGSGKDMRLVDADCQTFLTAIDKCQTTLKGLRTQTAGLADYATIGDNLPEAHAVREQLIATTNFKAVPAFDAINDFIAELVNGINAAVTRFHAHDQRH